MTAGAEGCRHKPGDKELQATTRGEEKGLEQVLLEILGMNQPCCLITF